MRVHLRCLRADAIVTIQQFHVDDGGVGQLGTFLRRKGRLLTAISRTTVR